jgi:DMSO/TMAO reductase YedYZ molybdopterin-dependent catalytic subunit
MRRLRSLLIPGVDKKLLVRDAAKLLPDPARRRFIAGGASLGALTLLTGCDVSDSFSAEKLLAQISKFNDKVQAAIFNPNTLAPTYKEADITRPFPFNGYYSEDEAPDLDGEDYTFEVRGLVDNTKSWTLDDLYKLPEVTQITRHVCVEGWSAIGSWSRCRRLQQPAGHGDRAASADPDDLQVRWRNPAAQVRLPDEDPGSDQARLQESKVRGLDGGHQRLQGRLLGGPGL